MTRTESITRAVKQYDRELYAQETKPGRTDIYRRSVLGVSPPHFLFSLTDNWKPDGRPVEYGVEVVMLRIKAHDLWRDDTFIENYIARCESDKESEDRARRNDIESFLYDFRRQFQRATNDINTANLSKD